MGRDLVRIGLPTSLERVGGQRQGSDSRFFGTVCEGTLKKPSRILQRLGVGQVILPLGFGFRGRGPLILFNLQLLLEVGREGGPMQRGSGGLAMGRGFWGCFALHLGKG